MIRFVTGTGAAVGKTVTTAALAVADVEAGKRVAYLKPVQTGRGPDEPGDADFVSAASGVPTNEALRFSARLDPALAAEQGAVTIGLEWLIDLARAQAASVDVLYVEGNGGLLSPLSGDNTTADLAQRLGADLVIVTSTGPDALNQVALSLEAARNRALHIVGVVVNRYPTHPGAIDEATVGRIRRRAQIVGLLPEFDGLDTADPPRTRPDLAFLPTP